MSTGNPPIGLGGGFAARVHDRFPAGWDGFIERAPHGSHLQTEGWGRVQEARGWRALGVAVSSASELVSQSMVVMRPIRGFGKVAYVAGGPLVATPERAAHQASIEALIGLARKQKVRLLVVGAPPGEPDTVEALQGAGFGPTHITITLPATVKVDLEPDEDDLLSGMKSKMRYNIRKAMRSGATVRQGTSADVPSLHRLVSATASRQGFVVPPLAHLQAMHDVLAERGHARLFLAEVEGVPVAGILTVTWGDTVVYKRGGWSGDASEHRPNELLHWTAIRWAKNNGYRWYDFDGIDPTVAEAVMRGEPIPPSNTESVSRFKLGFGGTPVLLPEPLSFVPNAVFRLGYNHLFPRIGHLGPIRRLQGT